MQFVFEIQNTFDSLNSIMYLKYKVQKYNILSFPNPKITHAWPKYHHRVTLADRSQKLLFLDVSGVY